LEIELTSVKKNPLLNRQEIEFKVTQKKTPSMFNLRIGVVGALKVDLNQVYIKEIETKKGTHLTLGTAHVYTNQTEALKIEPKHIIERNQKAKPEPEQAQNTESLTQSLGEED
jgi:ribosomal protein S24E